MGKIVKYKEFINESITKYLDIDLDNDFLNCVDLCYNFNISKDTITFKVYNTYKDNDSTGNVDVDKRIESKKLELDFYKELKFCLDRYNIDNYNVLEYINIDDEFYGFLFVIVKFKSKDIITITDDTIYINKNKLLKLISDNGNTNSISIELKKIGEDNILIVGLGDKYIPNLESIIMDSKLEIIKSLKYGKFTLFQIKDKLNKKFILV